MEIDQPDVANLIEEAESMEILKNDEEILSEQGNVLQSIQLDGDSTLLGDITADITMAAEIPETPVPEVNNPTTSQQASQPVMQTCRVTGATFKPVALAPKPVTLIASNLINPVKKISFSNIRPKAPTTLDPSKRQLVVVPTTDGRVKVVSAGASPLVTKTLTTQIGTGNQVILKQGSIPSLAKFAIVQGTDAAGNTTTKSARYLSLEQAQQMGIVSSGKIQQLVTFSPMKQASGATTTTIKTVTPTVASIKSPTKILPAPPKGTISAGKMLVRSMPQNVVIKTVSANQSQIKIEGGTTGTVVNVGQKINPQQIHQFNIPGKGTQCFRLIPANSAQKSGTSQIRLAPMSVTTQATSNSSNVTIQTKPAVMSKPVMIDLQGNILHISSSNSQALGSPGSPTNAIKNVYPKNQTKIVPMTFMPTIKKINTNVPNISVLNFPNQKMATDKNEEIEIVESKVMGKSKILDDLPDEITAEQLLAENHSVSVTPSSSNQAANSNKNDLTHILKVPPALIPQIQANQKSLSLAANVEIKPEVETNMRECSLDFGVRPRKPCNCTKSQCLKLYCDCFANGEFCNQCNCNNCYNNLENEDFRQKAIRTCLDRNPNAFRPKIGKAKNFGIEGIRRHNKGCNCKRSGCLKNYCECYEGKIACSANCKCIGCRNVEDYFDKRAFRKIHNEAYLGVYNRKIDDFENSKDSLDDSKKDVSVAVRKPWNYMTMDVIEAICNCLLAQASDTESFEGVDSSNAKRHILEEYGRCLQDMISAAQTSASSPEDNHGFST